MNAPARLAKGDCEVAIIGAGFSGLGMAIALKREDARSFIVLEKADDVGGTWRENRYPGCACDVPSHLYSYSFEPNPDWSRMFSPQPEIWDYLRHCATKYAVSPHIRFNSDVARAAWDEPASLWRITTRDGRTLSARALVCGMGGLHVPAMPDIAGRDDFAGLAWHSARWRHDVDLAGQSVGVIGTGASAIQIVPAIARKVKSLALYQRTPAWIAPRLDRPIAAWEKRLFRALPFTQELWRRLIYLIMEARAAHFLKPRASGGLMERTARRHLERQIRDPELRAKLTPDYAIGCKRVLISNDFYPALRRANVELVTEPIEAIGPAGVRAGGAERAHDALIYATGFRPFDVLGDLTIQGEGGRSLNEDWAAGPHAYLGMVAPGYPNLFFLMGPNTGLGHNSVIYMIESQIAFVTDYLRALDGRGLTHLNLRRERHVQFNAELQEKLKRSVWGSGCRSWYLSADGLNRTIWPGRTFEYRAKTRRIRMSDFEPARATAVAAK
jgi:cation diffusion facilitator CzcD-associated flavoprotein CzcO